MGGGLHGRACLLDGLEDGEDFVAGDRNETGVGLARELVEVGSDFSQLQVQAVEAVQQFVHLAGFLRARRRRLLV